ncbi:hypothetical protein SELMODRAFT_118690 [Selaginella moellendorffii]|uniref:C2 and GRAM domain-containing protein n=1 Tax=Selaginella moellendorffii TaxID=88036 RepID=D8SK74_SELML|nr:C2 and GRAM domain-containing protein At1g03370 [Selaginella moellendorffii]EFJ15178.1 hypothetical protein SELMODRAFT_118690 [Selaginella moellendorffii]|eukprot:XP_002983682.1 C2 and GRAM domain-containing protein At1g03370 [Selaginella moellendorffii]
MKLQVNVFEARGLAAKDPNGSSDPYVRLQLGRTKSSTGVIHACLNPVWNEEFDFRVDDSGAEILISVWDEDCFADDFLGQVKLPVSKILDADKLTLAPAWYKLQPRGGKSKSVVTGEILLGFSLYGRISNAAEADVEPGLRDGLLHTPSSSAPSSPRTKSSPDTERLKVRSRLGQKVTSLFKKSARIHPNSNSSPSVLSDQSTEECESEEEEGQVPLSFFEKGGLQLSTSGDSVPPPLSGGFLANQTYATKLQTLNSVLFKPHSPFFEELIAVQKTTDLVEGMWKKVGNENPKRVLTYTKAATAVVKSVKATEEQTYLRADDRAYVVLAVVSTPDVLYGSTFRTEVQYCLTPVSEERCNLSISWRLNFIQSTMAKRLIESGAKQGLTDNFRQYVEVLSKYVEEAGEDADPAPAEEQDEPENDISLTQEYFSSSIFIVVSLLFFLVVLLHIQLAQPTPTVGLEFWQLDLPDTFGELLTSAVITVHFVQLGKMALKKLRAASLTAGDHGKKAKGEGWLLTVTLVEGENLPIRPNTNCLDPYVVFTCSGRTRTSSVKLQTTNPKWGEIFEFDATEDPPSTLDVEVFNYDGPFPEAVSLGYAEINFLKLSPDNLADLWIRLEGSHAQTSYSRLHLRIFLTNTKEADTFVEYVKKVEKEAGAKVIKSSRKNASFQKLFSLPQEEFLINDFACAVKRKIPLQGRLFLSPRMLGFYSNIFGHKTKFSLLWEDIDEVQELPPSIANVGPSIVLFARKGRAHDANQGSKGMDGKGRLKFQFQSFVRAGPAFRTLMVLWKNRALTPEQQLEMVENVDTESKLYEDGEFIGVGDVTLSEVYSTVLPLTAASMVLLYEKENLEEKVMEKLGCMNYTVSPWENEGPGQRRQVNYRLNRQMCQFGSIVSGVQQKVVSSNHLTASVDEILTLHDVPFGDNFQIHVRNEVRTLSSKPAMSECRVLLGTSWQKGTAMQARITSNVQEHFSKHLIEKVKLAAKEISSYKDHHSYILV